MQTNEMKCAFSQEKKLTEQFIGSCTGTPGKAGAHVCGGSSGGVCVWGVSCAGTRGTRLFSSECYNLQEY